MNLTIEVNMSKKLKIGIIGCGMISDVYIKNIENMFFNMEVFALCDINEKIAKEKAELYGIKNVLTQEEMMASDEVEIILNLTTPQHHYNILKEGIKAGKHVFSEKPLALEYDKAKELKELAEKHNVLAGCAPDTFLGAGYQTARKALDDGLIGAPVSAMTFDVCHGHENWHMNPSFFYEYGGGPVFDRGPYNLSALVMLIGSVKSVTGMTSKAFEKRVITSSERFGQTVDVEIPTHVASLLQFENGTICTFTMSFDVWGSTLPKMELHGTTGSLILPDPNTFGGDVSVCTYMDRKNMQKIPYSHICHENSRGLGLSDMAQAVIDKRQPRCSIDLAVHVTEIMQAMHDSANTGKCIELESRCERPSAMPTGVHNYFMPTK